MKGEPGPEMSVVLPTPDTFATIRRTVRALRRQTIADRLEIVIVAPTSDLQVECAEVSGFAGVQVVGVGPITSSNAARVAGIRAARAPIVALAEDHCFPEAQWAASLLAAHGEGCAAVGPVLRNANPATAVSWSNFLAEYGHWVRKAAGDTEWVPGHNSSYRRARLLEFGDELPALMEAESVIQEALRHRGERLYFEPAASTNHYNFSRWGHSLTLRYHSGRLFAGCRISRWTWPRRLLYIGGAPLIPLVRARRILGALPDADTCPVPRWRLAAALVLLLIPDAAGELVGYLAGPGGASAALAAIEFHRERHFSRSDRRAYEAADA